MVRRRCFQSLLEVPTNWTQLRRQVRERRQYVYAKSLEAQERQTYERKQQLKDVLATGKKLPTELKKDARDVGRDLALDEAQAGALLYILFLLRLLTNALADPTTHIDNEYSRAGFQDPKIVITTSRDPSSKLLQFTKVPFFALNSQPHLTRLRSWDLFSRTPTE